MAIDECPNCDAELYLARYHSDHDYEMNFELICPACETLLVVDVTAEPVFHVTLDKEGN